MKSTLFLPVTRPWAVEAVVDALNASDIPRSVVLMLDAPECWGWFDALLDSGWLVTVVTTGRGDPPADRIARRSRHLAMRLDSQGLLKDYDRVLCVEDDTLVPRDVWTRLSGLLDRGYTAATGLEYTKDGARVPGVWRFDRNLGLYEPMFGTGIGEVAACGHYCLMTTGAEYAGAKIDPDVDEPVDRAHTKHLAPIAVDFDCICGHLREDGAVIR
jgi:hypothetical protein